MFRLVIFTDQSIYLAPWTSWLEKYFSITHVSNVESLDPLIKSWQPHILIYAERPMRLDLIQKKLSPNKLPAGLVVIAPTYDLKEETQAFQFGADHHLLLSTPVQGVKARLLALAEKAQRRFEELAASTEINYLPFREKKLAFEDLTLFYEHRTLCVNDKFRKLTPTQYRLLLAFFSHPNMSLSRKWFKENVFFGKNMSPRSIDAQIAKLKAAVPELRDKIINLYGQGYCLQSEEKKVS